MRKKANTSQHPTTKKAPPHENKNTQHLIQHKESTTTSTKHLLHSATNQGEGLRRGIGRARGIAARGRGIVARGRQMAARGRGITARGRGIATRGTGSRRRGARDRNTAMALPRGSTTAREQDAARGQERREGAGTPQGSRNAAREQERREGAGTLRRSRNDAWE